MTWYGSNDYNAEGLRMRDLVNVLNHIEEREGVIDCRCLCIMSRVKGDDTLYEFVYWRL